MRVFRRTNTYRQVAAGTDVVVGHCPLPAGAQLIQTWGKLHMIASTKSTVTRAVGYGFSGHVLPILDPDNALPVDTLWDYQVTKAVDPTTVAATIGAEFDWDTTNTTPELEPGELDLERVMGLYRDKTEFIDPRFQLLTWANARQGAYEESGTSYTPTDFKSVRSTRRMEVDTPSYALVGVSSPSMDDQVTAESTIATPGEWAIMENLESALDDFWKIQTGLIEVGAESPYSDISLLLEDLIAPPIFTPVSPDLIDIVAWNAYCEMTWEIDIPRRSFGSTLAGQ